MSLNGLDDPKIVEAHEAALAEPGGWFLLKYSSRDEVELLGKGNGGIAEIRNAVAGFEEESPLYGFLLYRRRNVIVKYLPEDCSRLIQARVAVHFSAVCERFTPYDTIFEISTATELRDTKLSAACSLHAASGSTASSTSSRRRRLMEIAEEDEEEQRSPKRQSLVPETDDGRPRTPGDRSTTADEVKLNSELASSPEHSKFSASNTSEVPKFMGVPDAPASPTRSVDTTDSRLDPYSYYPTSKPKVKLGPRPKTDATIRPQTAGNFRPVSSLPAGFKFGKGQKKSKGKDGDAASLIEEIPEMELPADAAHAPATEDTLGISGDASRPSTSTGLSTDTLSVPVTPAKPTMTPEKARLMKAMKLREKKKKQQQKQKLQPEDVAASGLDASAVEDKHAITGGEDGEEKELEHSADAAIESHDNDNDQEVGETNTQEQSEGIEDRAASISQADSGVVLDSLSSSVQIDEVSEGTRSESRAQSPAITSSEHDQSTAASSLSDSTNETVQAKNEDKVTDRAASTSVGMEDEGHQRVRDEPAAAANPAAAEGQHPNEEGQVAEVNASSSLSPSAAVVAVSGASSLGENESTAIQTKETGNSVALESTENTAAEVATGAANKGSANTENEKEKKGIAVPISKFSANIPTSKAPPAASLGGLGSGAAEIPLAAPGDVAQATDKGELDSSPLPRTLRSKLSTQDLVDAAQAAAQTTVATPLMELQMDPLSAAEETFPAVEKTSEAAAAPDEPKERSKRSANIPPPIQTDLTEPKQAAAAGNGPHTSDNDDALVQEIQGDAAAQNDNKPMVATKSPLTPVFPSATIANGPLGARAPPAHTVRTVSNPVRGNFIAPTDVTQSTARSLSSGAAFLHKVTQQQSASLATMKPNVGSSISQRIKALEKLSATSGDQARPVSRERPSSTFFAVQKRDNSRPPSVVDRTKSLKGRAASPTPSQDEFPPLEAGRVRLQRSGSVVSRVSMFEPLAASTSNASGLAPGPQSRGRPESVAVTTRIIRDPSQLSGYELPRDASDYNYLDLKQPPLMVDHHRGDEGSERRSRSLERDGEDDMGRRSSLNTVKGFFKDPRKSVTVSTNVRHAIVSRTTTQSPSSAGHRLSMSSRRSITIDRDNLANSSVTEDSFSGDERSDKKTSRAGRFMRKLSNLSSGSKSKNAASVEETSTAGATAQHAAGSARKPSVAPSASAEASIVSDLGDVNVQFPDSLLWKRRNLCLDSQGFIILSALPAQSSRTAQGTKRYHMGEFRQPYTPDVEVQELPNSVVLDFVEGTGIQLACEDRTGQLNVLHVLQAAHANHSR
ncbi:gpi-anchored cell surface glyco [Trichoderma arundinaceum]|uniref:Gpi-anchored cell surface glyco n=1 Tax=Trichoderma arundinaceum TaxID=490622 RepID=A0A395N9P7_TRIAR|nr:gpi-anchored cell surface glyco [Trichoderma arundinaceum]